MGRILLNFKRRNRLQFFYPSEEKHPVKLLYLWIYMFFYQNKILLIHINHIFKIPLKTINIIIILIDIHIFQLFQFICYLLISCV